MTDEHASREASNNHAAVMGLDLRGNTPVPQKQVFSWALWDWATQPFNTVIVTFVFTALYLTSDSFLPPELASLPDDAPEKEAALAGLGSGWGLGSTIAGFAILLLAPVLGQRADAAGRQKLWLGIGTGAMVLCTLALWFVEPAPMLFWLGVALISAGSVFEEIASVSNNALLISISTPKTVGRVSGLGWGFGYIGGVLALIIVIVLESASWFGMSTENGMAYRLIAVGCAVWTIVFAIPIFINVPEPSIAKPNRQVSFFRSYVLLARDVVALYRNPETRPTFWFLLASAVFRDGLSGVFVFGALIGAQAFGFDAISMMIFGVAANLVAGLSTIVAGEFDDRFGPKSVIIASLLVMITAGTGVFVFAEAGQITFWIGGLILSSCVGPAQGAARSFLARVTPAGREGEIFGLYATTGRAAGWMASLAWTILVAGTGVILFGILGIVLVLLLGLLLLLPVRTPR